MKKWKQRPEGTGKSTLRGTLQGILFGVLVLLLLVPLSYCLRTNGDIKDIFNGFYALKKDSLDVVMIGSSPVYPGVSAPMLWEDMGITSYPLSSNMQRPKAAIHLVREAEKTQNPGLYIFEMRMYLGPDERLTENMAYTRGVTDNMRYSLNRIRAINDLVPAEDPEGRLSYYFDILKYHSNWKTLVLPSQLATFAYNRPNPLMGAVVRDDLGPSDIADFSHVTEASPIPEEMEETLRSLCAYLKEQGLEGLFVVLPNTMTEEKQKEYNYIDGILQEEGFPFLNMNNHYDQLGIDFFMDFGDYGGHTNAFGMEKTTAFLEQYLKEHYSFEDKRGQAGFEKWEQAAILWQETLQEAKSEILRRETEKDYTSPAGEE